MTQNKRENPPADPTIISRYTQAQGVADGLLMEVKDTLAREAGFVWPVIITEHVHRICKKSGDFDGCLWDILFMGATKIRLTQNVERILPFRVNVVRDGNIGLRQLWLVSGPDDDGAPCITIMFPEDY